MSTFKNIQGKNIKSYANNAPNPKAGEMWYNRTDQRLKGVVTTEGWSAGGPLITGGYTIAVFGTQTSAIAVGATIPSTFRDTVQEYNGTGFSTETSYPATISNSGRAGTSTAGLIAGGWNGSRQSASNLWNGTAWTSTGALPTAADNIGSCGTGTQSNVIMAMGRIPTSGNAGNNTTAVFNGSTFSSGPNIGTGRMLAQSSGGTGTAGIIYGGFIDPSPNAMTNTEEYDGSSWTAGGSLNRASGLNCGWGTQTNAVAQVNTPGYKGAEQYNGTSWTNLPDMTLADNSTNYQGSAGSTGDAGFITSRGPGLNQTEEFTKSANIVTAAAWASGGSLNTARQRTGGFGAAQTSAVTAAGATAPPASAINKTEEYNGTSWTEGNNVNTARFNMTAFGTEPAGVLSGVGTPSLTYGGTTEEYNGTSWTTVNPYAAPGANYRSASGTLTAGLLVGGVAPAPAEMNNAVEEYDGTNWSNGNTTPQYQSSQNQAGSQTATINGGGNAGPAAPGPVSANTISLEYDGTNWTAGPNANLYSDRTSSFNGGSGTQTAAMFVGGDGVGTTTYDGTTFSTAPTVAAARGDTSAAGQAPAAATVIFAGSPVPSVGNTTLEFSDVSTSANIVNITTS
jgi:hypothetical protein